MAEVVSPTQQSQADVWYLKTIKFKGENVKIITQNFNGPCSFIAICNILILRKNITIEPATRDTVSYEFLSQLVAEYLLLSAPYVDISAALSTMPHTQKGLDLNPLFTSSNSFQAATQTAGGELKLFSQAGIDLVHGWLVDPDSLEAKAMRQEKTEDYDSAVALIAEADHISGGLLVLGEEAPTEEGGSRRRQEDWTAEERRKVENAVTIRHFLEQTQSQLTYHGLFHLASTVPAGSLVALFRSSHLSVLYKSLDEDESHAAPNGTTASTAEQQQQHYPQGQWQVLDDSQPPATGPSTSANPDELPLSSLNIQDSPAENTTSAQLQSTIPTPRAAQHASAPRPESVSQHQPTPNPNPSHASSLYMLATDQVFFNEPTVVWERIEDVDGSAGVFVDSSFKRSDPVGGDWAGHTAEDAVQRYEQEMDAMLRGQEVGESRVSDQELARQLQAEEYQQYDRQSEQLRHAREEEERRQKELHMRREKAEKRAKKKDCIIM